MQQFAFIIHPIDARRDVGRKYPWARYMPVPLIEMYIKRKDPVVVAEIEGIRSLTGEEARGWFIACPLTPRQMLSLPTEFVAEKLHKCGEIAQSLGAGILGLGAFTSIVGDGGITMASRLPGLAITTGNSYTVATAIEGASQAAEMMGHALAERACRRRRRERLYRGHVRRGDGARGRRADPVGRDAARLAGLAERLSGSAHAAIRTCTDVAAGLRDADIVITVTSAVDAVILPEHIKRGAVVCDVARPRDVSVRVARERKDVLVIEGGVVAVPGQMRMPLFGKPGQQFSFGFPPGTAYACMSETMALALEGRYESFTLGKEVSVVQVDEISLLAEKHGFHLAGFRSFEKAINSAAIDRIREKAFGSARKSLVGAPRRAALRRKSPLENRGQA